ncbi:hypothetical protein NC652_001419 [Populus alba x Populus x berolinensis]|nr:hypothetical protein NC652_001419 [Populus alba x Populus x berolinensis]
MTRGKQKIEAQRKNAERNQKSKGSQFEARAVALKVTCPICKFREFIFSDQPEIVFWSVLRDGIIAPLAVLHENILLHINPLQNSLLQAICKVQLANSNQLGDHYASKHPKEKPPAESS